MSENRITYNKLVRDRILENIEKSGGIYEFHTLDDQDFKRELINKVVEEAQECMGLEMNKDELVKEIGDLLDVIHELKKAFQISEKELEVAREISYRRKGGFERKIFLEWTSDTNYKKGN